MSESRSDEIYLKEITRLQTKKVPLKYNSNSIVKHSQFYMFALYYLYIRPHNCNYFQIT